MKVTVTPKELFDHPLIGMWDRVCDEVGLNPWAVNEGLMDSDEEITLTHEQAQRVGLLPTGGGGR